MLDWINTPDIFNKWREMYHTMSWHDQVEFYDLVWKRWPDQDHFPEQWFNSCFEYISNEYESASVFEIGGWRGNLAKTMLARFQFLFSWINYEVCRQAVQNSVCHDIRYKAHIPHDFPWSTTLPEADIFVSSHTLEHIMANEIQALFENLPGSVSFIALVLPSNIGQHGGDWNNYGGFHILEVGWKKVDAMAVEAGFELISMFSGESTRLYKR